MESAMDLDTVRAKLQEAIKLRAKYVPTIVPKDGAFAAEFSSLPRDVRCEFRDGLMQVLHADGTPAFPALPSVSDYYKDMSRLLQIRSDGAVGTFCYHRLKLLQMKFDIYSMVNFDIENAEQKACAHRDFYNSHKVDTHIHHSAAMNGKHLLRFIKKKLKRFREDIVATEGGTPLTLREVFKKINVEWQDLSLDVLNVMADMSVMHRFDRFNAKYSPLGNPMLRTVFLKTDNEMGGRYMAEITRELLDDLEEGKYQHTEWRISIYGRSMSEWENLAKWVTGHKLVSPHNMWMIQIPRLYSVYKSAGQIKSFQDMLDNIFKPLFDATLDPEGHPVLHEFLTLISGFDTVDDESKSEAPVDRTFSSKDRTPAEWNIMDSPSYKYYSFYLQSNIRTLNRLRASRGMSQFNYRPHAGEAGETHHLDTAFLLSDGISHGINLRRSMGLQYLFYLCEIELALSPCSNNQLFLTYDKHPFQDFFKRGLKVSLSTDDPLMFHQTKEPLMEEYSIAKQVWRLTSADLCELARNSVLASGFPDSVKEKWLGTPRFRTENRIEQTNVPNVRIYFRRRCLEEELKIINNSDNSADVFRNAFRAGFPLSPKCSGQVPLTPVAHQLDDTEGLENMQGGGLIEEDDEMSLRRYQNQKLNCCAADSGVELASALADIERIAGQSSPSCSSRSPRTVGKPRAGSWSNGTSPALGPEPSPTTGRRASQIRGALNMSSAIKRVSSSRPVSAPTSPQVEEDAESLGPRPKRSRVQTTQPDHTNGCDSAVALPFALPKATMAPPTHIQEDHVLINEVTNVFGETGLLSKLLSEYSFGVVKDLVTHLCFLYRRPDLAAHAPTPSLEVDAAWKSAALNTRAFQEVCDRCFGGLKLPCQSPHEVQPVLTPSSMCPPLITNKSGHVELDTHSVMGMIESDPLERRL